MKTSKILLLFLSLAAFSCSKTPEKKDPTSQQPIAQKEKVQKEEPAPARPTPLLTKALDEYCHKIDHSFNRWGWGKSSCRQTDWHHVRNSVNGDPLIWVSFGKEDAQKNTTMILCGVHGDEITPVKFCFDIIDHLYDNFHKKEYEDKMVIVAPIVSPDSFFKKKPTRTNARGVDVNRNFPTKDWRQDALRLWAQRYNKDKRRYPGKYALSEPETLFQVNLMIRYKPDKIISVHAPLTIIDYDGPRDEVGGLVGTKANQLLIRMSEKARGYSVRNYPFFPGSLGNYAGNERNIPTYTLELPSSDNRKSDQFWQLFRGSIEEAIIHDFRKDVDVARVPPTKKED